MNRRKMTLKDRINGIKSGKLAPGNNKEWAIYYRHMHEKARKDVELLNRSAAIFKRSDLVGKVVVIPPKQ